MSSPELDASLSFSSGYVVCRLLDLLCHPQYVASISETQAAIPAAGISQPGRGKKREDNVCGIVLKDKTLKDHFLPFLTRREAGEYSV